MIPVPQFENFSDVFVCGNSGFSEVYAMWFPWRGRIETTISHGVRLWENTLSSSDSFQRVASDAIAGHMFFFIQRLWISDGGRQSWKKISIFQKGVEVKK